MEINKKNIKIIAITAIVACLLTNTVRDIQFVSENGQIVKKTNTVTKLLKDYYLYDIDNDKLADYASLGMTMSLNEPYTKYFDKESFKLYQQNNMGSFIGIGLVISPNSEKNQLVVISSYEESPSEKAGILTGDIILAIDGESVDASNITDAGSKMRGDALENPIGTSVTVKVQRGNTEPFDVVLTRQLIQKQSVKSKMLSDGVAYMRISSFDGKNPESKTEEKDTFDEFMSNLTTLRNDGMKKLIIDLRGNPGGDLNVATNICDKLLPEGTITYTEDKKGKRNTIRSDSNEIGVPMVVLVNGGSASASEVLTGALKDFNKATVIGTKTYGKGIVQTVIPLTDGSGMSITSAKYFTPNGVCIHGIGIEPDIKLDLPTNLQNKPISQISSEEDIQLQKAIQVINAK